MAFGVQSRQDVTDGVAAIRMAGIHDIADLVKCVHLDRFRGRNAHATYTKLPGGRGAAGAAVQDVDRGPLFEQPSGVRMVEVVGDQAHGSRSGAGPRPIMWQQRGASGKTA